MTRRLLAAPALLLAVLAPAQNPPQRELCRPLDFLTGQDDNLFSLRRSQDDIHEWELGIRELENGEFAAAVERLHRLLQNEGGGVVPVGPGRYLSQRLAVIGSLANLSPAAAEVYEALVRREAGHLVDRPLHTLETEQLEQQAYRYPASRAGRAARLRLGDLALERGAAHEAMGHFRAALDATTIGSTGEREVYERCQATAVLLAPERARRDAERGTLPPAAADVLAVIPEGSGRTGWVAVGGGGDGSKPMTAPQGTPSPNRPLAIHAPGFSRPPRERQAMMPVGDLDGIYVNTGRKVVAFDPLRRAVAWESLEPLPDAQDAFELGEVNPDMVLAAAYGDEVVTAALQVPDESMTVTFHNGIRILSKIPQRRMFGFERSTGKLLWTHFDHRDGPSTRRFAGHDACGPPLVAGDTVFVPTHDRAGAIAFSVAAYDLATGEPKWRRLVCSSQQEVNMFGNERMEFAASPLCLHEGVIYGASNLGVAFAIDATDGLLRWVAAYEVVRMPTTSLVNQVDRTVFFRNNSPIVARGVVCLTPLDSPSVLGIDCETARTLWRVPADAPVAGVENDVRWLAGVFDDEFVLTGRGAVAVAARDPGDPTSVFPRMRQLVPPQIWLANSRSYEPGRPAVTPEQLWVARIGAISAFDRNGNAADFARQIRAAGYEGGNLLLVDGIVVSLRQGRLETFLDPRAIQAQVQQRLREAPDDPAAILRLATLRAALLPPHATSNEHAALTALYRTGLEACLNRGLPPDHPVRTALQRELFALLGKAATDAIAQRAPDALERLAAARTAAPDVRSWIEMQQLVLGRCADDPGRLAVELDRLEQKAGDASLPLPDGPQPVRAYVLWRRTELPAAPAAKVALWQELLEKYPDARLAGEPVTTLAPGAIAALIERHGDGCYAAVAARAQTALGAAGADPEALRAVGQRFPNSRAAELARTRLLDAAVARGALDIVGEALARELTRDEPQPGVLRRVLEAARVRGNLGLARAVADRLAPFGERASDWPADAGRTLASVLAELRGTLDTPPPTNRLGVPIHELGRIRPRSAKETFRRIELRVAPGFVVPTDVPLFVTADRDLLAIDVHADSLPILFATPVGYGYLDHIVLCGKTLVVWDFDRVFALDYRTGRTLWERQLDAGTFVSGLGVREGVLHLSMQPSRGEGRAPLLGIEPLSGALLFERALTCGQVRPVPKPIASGHLVAMQAADEHDATLLRLDPLTGRTLASVRLATALPGEEDLAPRIYPKMLCGDAERIYLPIDSAFGSDAPRVYAVTDDGRVAWSWQGVGASNLPLIALRGDRLVVLTTDAERAGRLTILRATDGEVLRSVPLGHDITILNWQRGDLPTPAPPALLLSDFEHQGGRERRLLCIGIDDGMPSFAEPLSLEFGEIESAPQFGPDFLAFGVRPRRFETFRLYALRLSDRQGAYPGGQKYAPHRFGPTYSLSTVGPYTVIYCSGYLVVLGPEERNR